VRFPALLSLLLALAVAGCSLIFATGELRGAPEGGTDAAPEAHEAGSDAGAGDGACSDDTPFAVVTKLEEIATPVREGLPRLLPDELTIYFQRESAPNGRIEMFVARRASRSAKFDPPTLVAELDSAFDDTAPAPTADGLTMYFASNRDTDGGLAHLYRTGRPAVQDPFGLILPVTATLADAAFEEKTPFVSAGGGELFYATDRDSDAGLGLWSARVLGTSGVQAPAPLGLPYPSATPVLTADGRTLYFSLANQIYFAPRLQDGGFDTPTPAPGLGSSAADRPGWISPDRCRLYFGRNADALNSDLFVAERSP
jgi:hypothetical protein